ncbi:MAG: hypothetical protein U1U88_000245 [Lawsonella clevelandensis]
MTMKSVALNSIVRLMRLSSVVHGGARMTGGGFGGSAIALINAEDVDKVEKAVLASAAHLGLAAPSFIVAVPSEGAGRDR